MVAQGEADGQLAYLQLSGEVDAVASLDGDIVVHGVTEFYTKVNYHTGAAFRYKSNCWEKRIPPGERQFQVTSLLEVPWAPTPYLENLVHPCVRLPRKIRPFELTTQK